MIAARASLGRHSDTNGEGGEQRGPGPVERTGSENQSLAGLRRPPRLSVCSARPAVLSTLGDAPRVCPPDEAYAPD
jgi:hypothetical protein